MQPLRPAAVAGSFYPSNPEELRAMVLGLLSGAPDQGEPPKAVIAPHAGYAYSGRIAAHAFARLGRGRSGIRRVVLLGPAHRTAFLGLAVTGAHGFATPLGTIPVDRAGIETALEQPGVRQFEPAYAGEHSLEVELPFLQQSLDSFALVPVVVGQAAPGQVAELLERLWGGPETAIVVSSDLSHYLDAVAASRMDADTSAAIRDLRPDAIADASACGSTPVRGLLSAARRHGLQGEILALAHSGDTTGDLRRVVGYGAYAFR
jgi:hypothetical protein